MNNQNVNQEQLIKNIVEATKYAASMAGEYAIISPDSVFYALTQCSPSELEMIAALNDSINHIQNEKALNRIQFAMATVIENKLGMQLSGKFRIFNYNH